MKESRPKENKLYPICLKAYGYYPTVTNLVLIQKITPFSTTPCAIKLVLGEKQLTQSNFITV